MTKESIAQVYEAASAGILRPQLAANILPDVCETALALFKTVEQQKAQIEILQRAHSPEYVP
jgi:hypothetical protein